MSYKNLALNITLILPKLREFCEGECAEISKGQEIHYNFAKDGKPCLIILYKKNGGLVTLHPAGKNPEISAHAIDFIIKSLTVGGKKSFCLSLPGYTKEKLDTIVQYLTVECGAEISEEYTAQSRCGSLKVKGKQGDVLTFNLYTSTGTLTVQGRPVLLASELVTFLAEDEATTQEEIFGHLTEIFGTTTQADEAQGILSREYPHANRYSGPNLKKLMGTAISMRGLPIEVDDYSVISAPALRALEAFMKKAVLTATNENWQNFEKVFNRVSQNPLKYQLKEERRTQIACPTTCTALEECYPHYVAHRHGTFHASGVDEATRIIKNRAEAIAILETALGLIESHSNSLLGIKRP